MKFASIAATVAFAALIFAGCKATTSPNGTTTTPGSMVATVNGAAWSSAVVPGVSGGATGKFDFPSTGNLTITGISSDLTEITIEIMHPHVGTDTLLLSGDIAMYSQGVPDTSKDYVTYPSFANLMPGTVTITSYDTTKKQISGSFNFIARKIHTPTDTVKVTGGSFYQVGW